MPEHITKARIIAYLLVFFISVPLALATTGNENKPNIVLVLMDNFGYGEIM